MAIFVFSYVQREKMRVKKTLGLSSFFVFVALAFMFLELGYLNSLFLIFSSPIIAFSILLFIFLFFVGIGAFIAHIRETYILYNLKKILLILSVLILGEILFIPGIVSLISDVTFIVQLFVLAIIMGIPAILIGIIFPVTLKKASEGNKSIMIFIYLLDSFVSVFAGIIALVVSSIVGFNMLLVLGAVSYIAALFLVDNIYTQESITTK